MMQALVIMIIRCLYTAYALLAFLEQAAPLPQQLRPLLYEHGRFPNRRRAFGKTQARRPARSTALALLTGAARRNARPPAAAYSLGNPPPTPTPRCTRPLEIMASVLSVLDSIIASSRKVS
jgi:hypothetical protein